MARKEYPLEFEQFWEYYPRKVCKWAAYGAWFKATCPVNGAIDAETLMVAAATYAKAVQMMGKETIFVPHASTWLNQRRWEVAV